MVTTAPELSVSFTTAGGLGLLLLSCWAETPKAVNNIATHVNTMIFFISVIF
ncbi:hypothetical protein D3C87_1820810 [compost metagenome]